MKKYNVAFYALVIIILAFSIYEAISNDSFWEFNLSSSLTLLTALCISYFLTQKQEDSRIRKEIFLGVINKIQNITQDSSIINIQTINDKDSILMRNRSLNNYICILEQYKKEFDICEDVSFIREKFDEYKSIIDNHINDIQYLSKSEKELSRPIELINSRLYEIMLRIYK